MGVLLGNPIVISGPHSGLIVGQKSLKIENTEWYAYTSGATFQITKKTSTGKLYAEAYSTEEGATATRDFDGMWFRAPFVKSMTSGVIKIWLR